MQLKWQMKTKIKKAKKKTKQNSKKNKNLALWTKDGSNIKRGA